MKQLILGVIPLFDSLLKQLAEEHGVDERIQLETWLNPACLRMQSLIPDLQEEPKLRENYHE